MLFKNHRNLGFSLIELLVALSILAVVAALIIPRFLGVRSQAAYQTTVAQRQALQQNIQHWMDLGGTVTPSNLSYMGFPYATSFYLIKFLSQGNNGQARVDPAGICKDSVGVGGSGTVSLPISYSLWTTPQSGSSASFPIGFILSDSGNSFSDKWAFYHDGTGAFYSVLTSSITGKVMFNYEGDWDASGNIIQHTPPVENIGEW